MSRFASTLVYFLMSNLGILALIREPRKFLIKRYPRYYELDRKITHWALGVVAAQPQSMEDRVRKGKIKLQHVTLISLRLWSGHSTEAVARLKSICAAEAIEETVRANAAISLAVFVASKDMFDECAHWLERSEPWQKTHKDLIRWKLLKASLLRKEGQYADLEAFTSGWEENHGEPDLFWISLNTFSAKGNESGQERWLASVNSYFSVHGLQPIHFKFPEKGLHLGNFEGEELEQADRVSGPLVSVIIPAFNAGERIAIALKGLIEQTWSNLEIIVVDDCSSDNTVEVVEKFAELDPRIRVVRQERNGGCYLARNKGLELAKGDFITTHDIDDWSHPQKIEWQVKPLVDDDQRVASISHALRCTEDMVVLEKHRALTVSVMLENSSSLLFRREIVDAIGPWDRVRTGGDSEFIKRVKLVYGQDAILTVAQSVPLSFVLGGHDSLTNAGPTHISSLYYGVRREYNGRYLQWHEQFKKGEIQDIRQYVLNKQPETVPGLIRPEKDRSLELTHLFILDALSDLRSIDFVLKFSMREGVRVGIFHWPSEKSHPTRDFNRQLRELVVSGQLEAIYVGQVVKAELAYLLSPGIFDCVPDRQPELLVEKVAYVSKGEDVTVEKAWVDHVFGEMKDQVKLKSLNEIQ